MAQDTGSKVRGRKLDISVPPGYPAHSSYFSESLWIPLGAANVEMLRITYDALSISLAFLIKLGIITRTL